MIMIRPGEAFFKRLVAAAERKGSLCSFPHNEDYFHHLITHCLEYASFSEISPRKLFLTVEVLRQCLVHADSFYTSYFERNGFLVATLEVSVEPKKKLDTVQLPVKII